MTLIFDHLIPEVDRSCPCLSRKFVLITGRPARSAAMPVLFLLIGANEFFAPQGRHVVPINVKSAPPCQILRLSGQKCGNTAPKLSKFRILAINSPLRGDSFAVFLRNYQRLYPSIGRAFKFLLLVWSLSADKQPSYTDFPAVVAFSHKFSVAPSGETTDRIKKSWRCAKMGLTSSVTIPSILSFEVHDARKNATWPYGGRTVTVGTSTARYTF